MSDLIDRKVATDAVQGIGRLATLPDNDAVIRMSAVEYVLFNLPSAQPELIEQGAYVRGFEQGRTQGMLDAKLQPTCNQLATDTISRQAAIDAAIEAINEWGGGWDAEREARDAINALPSAQPEPQWIPCSERLPDKNQICIVTDDKRDITYEYGFHPETNDEVNGWTYLGHKIIAWMSLPEPWRGEEHGET